MEININLKFLITGVVGFIGFYLSQLLLKYFYQVIGIDNLNTYYTPQLKEYCLKYKKCCLGKEDK